ncbi:ATP-binding cassette domain-containing protein [Streptomyces sp. HMX112]|uniref:ATP-binding cassette domain-containing protein n=1 Tax=Streptomyces sp. HMX112 TaxID=3390850 RepID=UPI003A806E39
MRPWPARSGTPPSRAVVAAALARAGLTGPAARLWKALSGGERQRAHIARAPDRWPRCVLLDEPANHLDVTRQSELGGLPSGTDRTVLVAPHDLSPAARFRDRLLLVDQGHPVAAGTPRRS